MGLSRPGDKPLFGQWWLVYWRIYSLLGLNELNVVKRLFILVIEMYIQRWLVVNWTLRNKIQGNLDQIWNCGWKKWFYTSIVFLGFSTHGYTHAVYPIHHAPSSGFVMPGCVFGRGRFHSYPPGLLQWTDWYNGNVATLNMNKWAIRIHNTSEKKHKKSN